MTGILYVPSEGHRERVLGDGPCGSRPPTAWQAWRRWDPASGIFFPIDPPEWRFTTASGTALVLAYKGSVVPEGVDRLARVLGAAHDLDLSYGYGWVPRFSDGGCWYLYEASHSGGGDVTFYEPEHPLGELRGDHEVPGLGAVPIEHPLAVPWSLAIVAAARLGGEVVVLPAKAGEEEL